MASLVAMGTVGDMLVGHHLLGVFWVDQCMDVVRAADRLRGFAVRVFGDWVTVRSPRRARSVVRNPHRAAVAFGETARGCCFPREIGPTKQIGHGGADGLGRGFEEILFAGAPCVGWDVG